jgi:acetyl/propionyl-CoA carboxylase alpha subunit
MTQLRPITRVLVADRGEVGARLVRAVEAAGLESVAVFSDADADAPYLDEAAFAVHIPHSGPGDPYLDAVGLVTAALDSGADAVHPGFRGLARSEVFARTVHNVGLTWLGPRIDDLAWTLDRARARARARDAGLEILPSSPLLHDVADVAGWCERFGFPVVVRPGVRGAARSAVVHDLGSAQRALGAAGEVGAFVERALAEARHVAVIVVGDGAGNAVHVGEHESSILGPAGVRLRECPSAGVDAALREKIGMGAADFVAAWRYFGAASVHFLIGPDGRPWFLDVDPGLPDGFALHDLVYGTDLVGAQVSLAAGEELGWDQEEIAATGAAAEVSIALRGRGRLKAFRFPHPEMLEAIVAEGQRVDPVHHAVLARVRVHGPSRHAALVQLRAQLEAAEIGGVDTDLGECVAMLADRALWEGRTARRVVQRGKHG